MQSLTNFAAALLCLIPAGIDQEDAETRQRVDLIELNHFVDDEGREVFRQLIFYDWSQQHQEFHVRGWRLIKSDAQLPQQRWNQSQHQQCWRCRWYDAGLQRQVWAPKMRETWSQLDPERVNRERLPEDQRRPLFPARIAENEANPSR
jgi:hypothetical protein